jgi:sulfatase maturation enzyme AslB (radical SAM superfamily)
VSFCPHAWNTLSVIPGQFAPCCWFMFHWEIPEGETDLLNSPQLAELRRKMLAGEKIPQCRQCDKNEELGIESKRQNAIKKFGSSVPEIKLKELDVAFDNICNLKCRGCTSSNSHLWKKDEELIYGKSIAKTKYIENDLIFDLTEIEAIEISGGEPLLSPRFKPFFNKIRDTLETKSLSIVTNGTILLEDDVIQDLKRCKFFGLAISIDGLKDTHNYFRSGNVYDTIIKNLDTYYKEFSECKNVKLEIITTVNIYNLHELNEMKKQFNNYPNITWTCKPLDWPEKLSIKNLPNEYKEKIKVDIPHIKEFLNEEQNISFNEFIEYHNKLDSIRNERLPDSILSEYLNDLYR